MFEKLPLHDATLHTVNYDWLNKTCTLAFSIDGSKFSELIFEKVSEVHIPQHAPWGPSVSVNILKCSESTKFEVEMQSGDILAVSAASWRYTSL